jgi:hypothetical protein
VAAREGGSVVDAGKQKDERENESDGRHEHLTLRCMQASVFQCTTARFLSFMVKEALNAA